MQSLPVGFPYRDLRFWKVRIEGAGEITFVTRRNTMSNSFNKKQIGLAAACALALGILSGAAGAQDAKPQGGDANYKAYLDDVRGAVAKNRFGDCWHTGFGLPPASSAPECDPSNLSAVAYVAKPVMESEPVPPVESEPVSPVTSEPVLPPAQ
jgi:hypothetical protein